MIVSSASRTTAHVPAGRFAPSCSTRDVAARYACSVAAMYSAEFVTQRMLSGSAAATRATGVAAGDAAGGGAAVLHAAATLNRIRHRLGSGRARDMPE